MRRVRLLLLSLGLGALSGGGCSHDGDYQITWQFVGPSGTASDAVDAADGCGLHGVDSVLITGSSNGGNGTNVIALCTPGSIQRSVPAGTWTFSLNTLDVHGKTIQPLDMPDGTTGPLAITEGGPVAMFPVITITPRPQCSDGIDNDLDGRVDLDDPDCGGDPTWNDEAHPKAQ